MKLRLKPIHEQVIVITGATSGIGLATARLAHQRGARVVLAARSERALAQLADELGSAEGRAIAVRADVSVAADVERIGSAACGAFRGFDTWVNNAAVSAYAACLDITLDDMRRIFETNFWGTVHGSRTACAHLRRAGGALINVGSVVSDRAVPLQGTYSATKHAIKAWTDALRTELAYERAPVSVTLIKPSAIDTPYALHARNYLGEQPTHTPPVYTPESVARAILFAAEHQVRDVVVGSAGKVLSLGSTLMPRVVDTVLSRVILPATFSGRPSRGRPILNEPSEQLSVRGDYQGIVRPSIYTSLITHGALRSLTVGAAMTLAALALGAWSAAGTVDHNTSAGGGVRPNTRRSTARAAQ